jgi:hypothetical protein
VKVVDVEDIYAQFGHAVRGAQPIRDYIAYAHANLGTRMVLLVGGDSYDYLDHLGKGAISFVPTPYTQTDDIVRFAADEHDANQGYSFSADSDNLIDAIPRDWSVARAYMDERGLSGARDTLMGAINGGVALTSFFGHSSYGVWSFNHLLTSTDVAGLENFGRPTVVTQWGCWNTYYVLPSENTMGHEFLLNGDRGAVAVLGASTLTEARAEREMSTVLFGYLLSPGMTIGDAVLQAKRDYAALKPDQLDVILGLSLLGDPALTIGQP